MPKSLPQCTCQHQQQQLPPAALVSDFHKSLSVVDYIDLDVSEASSSSKQEDDVNDNDPLSDLRYLFDDINKKEQEKDGDCIRRIQRRSTNTSSISADSGYCDIPMPSSKLIPVHLISCTLIPVNVTRTKSMDIRCLACTCGPPSNYFTNKTERRRRLKSSTNSNSSRTYSRSHMDTIENEIHNHCSCNKKYYSTMTICPTLPLSSPTGTTSTTAMDGNHKDDYYYKHQQQKRHSRRHRTSLLK